MTLSLTTRANTPYTGGLINSLPTTLTNTPYTGGLININGDDSNNVLYGNLFDNVMNGKGGDDVMYGDDGNDTITGGSGRDYISGENGNDILYAGAGDTLSGGNGCDVFIIQYPLGGFSENEVPTILDFDSNCDIIRVSENSLFRDSVISGAVLSASQSPMEFVQEGYAISVTPLGNGISTVTIGSAL